MFQPYSIVLRRIFAVYSDASLVFLSTRCALPNMRWPQARGFDRGSYRFNDEWFQNVMRNHAQKIIYYLLTIFSNNLLCVQT